MVRKILADQLNYKALHTRTSIRMLKKSNAKSSRLNAGNRLSLSLSFRLIMAVIGIIFCISILSINANNPDYLYGMIFFVIFITAFAIYSIDNKMLEDKLARFAADNALDYSSTLEIKDKIGIVQQVGHSQTYVQYFWGKVGLKNIGFGNYEYTIGNDKQAVTRTLGTAQIKLSKKLPNILLDSKTNNHWSGFSATNWVNDSQILLLEGDFNKYFTVYVPKDYERDALYFLTPELMAVLVDYISDYDIEIVDNYVIIYSSQQLDYSEASIKTLLDVIDVVSDGIVDNTKNYHLESSRLEQSA